MPKVKGLTVLQKRFVEVFDGNGTRSAKNAGYKGSDRALAVIAHRNLQNPEIIKLIKAKEKKRVRGHIMSRMERQEFWTKIALDEGQSMADRLRAVSDLAKSEGDFLTRIEVSDDLSDRMKEAERRLEQQEDLILTSGDNSCVTDQGNEEEDIFTGV